MIRFFNPGLAYTLIKDEVLPEIMRVLTAGDLILRKDIDTLEQNLAEYVGTKYAVAVASGTDALILSLKVAGIGPGDEVITNSYTFRATIEAIHHVGATPIVADMGEDWRLYKTQYTKAIIPCHIAGEVVNWVPDQGIIMIEDACQAIGAAPVKGLTACYSFYPAKILGCYGDGGAIATNDASVYNELLLMRNHYKGDWKPFGYNSRLDNLQAAVLNVKIKHLPEAIRRRKKIAELYDLALKGVELPSKREVYQDYIVVHKDVPGLRTHLEKLGIETMANGYPFPEEVIKKPKTIWYEEHSLRLPIYPELSEREQRFIIDAVNCYE